MRDDRHGAVAGGFHLERSVSIGHLLTTGILLVSALFYVFRIEGRTDQNEQGIDFNRQRIERVERRNTTDIAEIKSLLRRIEDKLDRKADK
jgi:hypothetical protein